MGPIILPTLLSVLVIGAGVVGLAVARALANALEAGQQARLDLCLKLTGLGFQVFLLLAGLLHDFLQFVALVL